MGKYDSLRDVLSHRAGSHVTMTFDEIGGYVGGLPGSARTRQTWWTGNSQAQARAWRAAGWHVSSVNQAEGTVVFARESADPGVPPRGPGVPPPGPEATAQEPEGGSVPVTSQPPTLSSRTNTGMKRTYRYLSRRGFVVLSTIQPVYHAMRIASHTLQLLRAYASDDHLEITVPLSRIWPFKRMTLALDGETLTLQLPSLPAFIRKRVKFNSKTDPLSTFRTMLYTFAITMGLWRLIMWPFWAAFRFTYRTQWALIRCWTGTLRTSVGSAPALMALFVVVFTTGDAWRFFGLEPTSRFLVVVFILVSLSVAAMIAALLKMDGGWRACSLAIATADDTAALQCLAGKTPARDLAAPSTTAINVPVSVAYASPWVRLNIYVLFWLTLLLHLLSIGLLVTLVFIIVGLVAVTPEAASSLVEGRHYVTYFHFSIARQPIILTRPLLLLSITLGCIAMLTLTSVTLREEKGLNNFLSTALAFHRRSLAALTYYFQTIFAIQQPWSWPEIFSHFDLEDKDAAYKLTMEILCQSDALAITGFLKVARQNRILTIRPFGLVLLAALPEDKLRSLPVEEVEFMLTAADDDPARAALAERVRSHLGPAPAGQVGAGPSEEVPSGAAAP